MNTPLGFGGIQRTVDDRDFELASYSPPITIHDTFIQDVSNIPVYNQGKYSTCGAHAGAFLDSKLQTDKTGSVQSLSPKYLWDQIKQIDGFSLEEGTDMRSIFRSLVNTGDCDLSLLANDPGNSIQNYSSIRNVTDVMRYNAYQKDLQNYAFINNPTWDQIKQAIFQNKAVLALVDIGDGWWLPDWQHVLPITLGKKVGHHFVTLHSYDLNRIYFRNSWGTDWGNQGDGHFDHSYLPHILEIGTAIVLPAPYVFKRDLQRGMANSDIVHLQRILGVIDTGFFGLLTFAAVQKYQTDNNINPTGYVGPKTREVLNTST